MNPDRRRREVRQAIEMVLSCCLQNDNNIMHQAMERKRALEVVEDYPMILCEIIASTEAYPERHLASVFLKNYLEEIFETQRNHTPLHMNNLGRRLCSALLRLLDIENFNIKMQIAMAIGYITAHCQEFWECLSPCLMNMLLSDNPTFIENAVYTLRQVFQDDLLNKTGHNIGMRREFFDGLMNVFKDQRLLAKTRAATLSPMLMMVKYSRPSEANQENPFAEECMYKFGEEFERALGETYSIHSDFHFKSNILQSLVEIVETYDILVACVIPGVLPVIGTLLTVCCDKFKQIVKGETLNTVSNETKQDFFELIAYTLEFVKMLVDMQYFDILIEDLENFLHCMYIFMACQNEEMEQEAFSQCVDKGNHFLIRDSCADIVKESLRQIQIRRKNGRDLYWRALNTVFEKLNTEIQHGPQIYNIRLTESMMYGLGLCHHWHDKVANSSAPYKFPVQRYVQYWTNMLPSYTQLLKGRLLWVGSKYSCDLTHDIMHHHIKIILASFGMEDAYLRHPSATALKGHLKSFEKNNDANKFVILQFSREILSYLLSIINRVNENSLVKNPHADAMLLNTLGHFLRANKELAIQNIDAIEQVVINFFNIAVLHVDVLKKARFIISVIAEHSIFKNYLQSRVLRFLIDIIQRNQPNDNDMKDRALDGLYTYVLYASEPLDNVFVLQTFGGAVMEISRLIQEDHAPHYIDDTAGNLLCAIVVKASEQLKQLKDERGIPILQNYPQLIEMILQPDIATLPGRVLGRLIIVSVYFLPELMVPQCMAILRSMVTTKTHLLPQLTLIFEVFCFISMLRPTESIDFLSFLPGPHGGSALNHIIKLWRPSYNRSIHKPERQIMTMSIIAILQFCLSHESAYNKVKDCFIQIDGYDDDDEPIVEAFNGIEYLYYLLLGFLFCELKEAEKILPEPIPQYNAPPIEDIEADHRVNEESSRLFRNHIFNINIVERIAMFLKTRNKAYFNVVYRYTNNIADYHKLRELGCALPPFEYHEDME